MARKNVANLLVDTLAGAGVERMYGVSGDSLNGITDAIRRHEQMRWIHLRHEETAAFAAGADAHLTGQLAVCAGSCGPGNLHLINGLYDCHRSCVPVLCVTNGPGIAHEGVTRKKLSRSTKRRDQVISPNAKRAMVERINATFIALRSSRVPMLYNPVRVAVFAQKWPPGPQSKLHDPAGATKKGKGR